jgi:hypothetical protein
MSGAIDGFVEELAERVAQRVVELQQAEAARARIEYLAPAAMATRMGVAPKTLANLRSRKQGPKFVKVGGRIRYPVAAEEAT